MTTGEVPDRPARTAASISGRLSAALKNPVYRSSYALVLNTAGTTLIGVVYWALATHLYSHEAVGRASALVAALIMVSSIAQLNLSNTLPRFLPPAKRRAGRLIMYCYSASAVAAALGGMLFIVVMPKLSANWGFLTNSAQVGALFVLAVAIWGVFALEDAALTGLGRAVVVPIENVAYGVLKLGLLVAVASMMPSNGIFFSWITPLFLCVPIINWLIFWRYLPSRETARVGSEVPGRAVVRHASLDYVGSLFNQAVVNLPSLLVLSLLGPVANGYFYIAWTIGSGLGTLAGNFATSLLAEGSSAPHRLDELTRGTLNRSLAILVPAALFLAVAGKFVLGIIYGSDYAAHATVLLALLAVGAIPRGLVLLAVSIDRIKRNVSRATYTQLSVAGLVMAGSWVLLKTVGIDGVGYAWIGAHSVVAAARLRTVVGAARKRRKGPPPMLTPRRLKMLISGPQPTTPGGHAGSNGNGASRSGQGARRQPGKHRASFTAG